jgi:predicted dithiol-disulfide oxidoreductase (DUF899 family)
MNNKWEEERKNFGNLKFKNMRHFGRNADTDMIFETCVIPLLSQREAEIRKEAVNDYLKSEEGKVYQDYQTIKKQIETEIRKETILAVLPKEKEYKTLDLSRPELEYAQGYKNHGYNSARQSIIDKAKEKFGIII